MLDEYFDLLAVAKRVDRAGDSLDADGARDQRATASGERATRASVAANSFGE
jgi:hypothetical protein